MFAKKKSPRKKNVEMYFLRMDKLLTSEQKKRDTKTLFLINHRPDIFHETPAPGYRCSVH